jgi:predicted TIM-barrel fold metal-dependent hydrolase
MKTQVMQGELPIYKNMNGAHFNAHAHCFTIDHVPEEFFDVLAGGKRFLRISRLRRSPALRTTVKVLTSSFIRHIVKWFSPNVASQLKRLHGLVKYSIYDRQEDVINILDNFYDPRNRLVLLSMDLHGMDAGAPGEDYITQLDKLSIIKKQPAYYDKIFPFVFSDPRRQGVDAIVERKLKDRDAPFQGIKIYPAVGYYPFDKRLKNIYQFAIDNEVPVLTHCIDGPVFNRSKLWEQPEFAVHPYTGQSTTPSKKFKDPAEFQLNLSHPLNYECLLNKNIASQLFGEAVDFSKLKICIAHFGGDTEWMLYKQQEKNRTSPKYAELFKKHPLDTSQPWLGEPTETYSWLHVVRELIMAYDNVYADISFTLHDTDIYPMLKEMLTDERLKNKILFGTDYYVVASTKEEPELITDMVKFLTKEEIQLIAYTNPLRFLNSKLNPITL